DGQQAESYGAGRVFAGPDPLPGGGKNQQPAHNVTARVTRKAPGPLVKRSTALEAESVDTPANKAYLKTVGAELKQNAGYNEILNKGEIGILRPGNISTKGVDAITAEIKGDKARIFLNDFTSPDASKLEKETWKNWYKELAKSMETLSFDDKRIETAIKKAFANNEVYVRTVRVEIPSTASSDHTIRPSLTFEILGQVKP